MSRFALDEPSCPQSAHLFLQRAAELIFGNPSGIPSSSQPHPVEDFDIDDSRQGEHEVDFSRHRVRAVLAFFVCVCTTLTSFSFLWLRYRQRQRRSLLPARSTHSSHFRFIYSQAYFDSYSAYFASPFHLSDSAASTSTAHYVPAQHLEVD